MSAVGDLAAFIGARLDEDEAAAKAATPGAWHVNDESYPETIYDAEDVPVIAGGRWGDEASVFDSAWDALHIARHDPARVLREVAAKRAIMTLHYMVSDDYVDGDGIERAAFICNECDNAGRSDYWPCPTVRHLAAIWSDHPEYRGEWKP